MDYCSPTSVKKDGGCFSRNSLINLVKAWNETYTANKIKYNTKTTNKELWNLLNKKMTPICKEGNDWCWPSALKEISKKPQVKKVVNQIAEKELRPEKPEEWLENPKEWLSNFDIENVMKQYNDNPEFNYYFIGVFPIDFSVIDGFGKCLYSEFCNLQIKKYINKGIKYIGLITNLDKHDQPGSHWTSTFIVIDPKLKSYGAYYYDSTARTVPKYVVDFLKGIKTQADLLYPNKTFSVYYNKKQHQKKNTECGVFSIIFQLRWIHKLQKNKDTMFPDIINDDRINDDNMNKIRDSLYRPNIKSVLKLKNG